MHQTVNIPENKDAYSSPGICETKIKEKINWYQEDYAVLADHKIKVNKRGKIKINKLDLAGELKNLWNIKAFLLMSERM